MTVKYEAICPKAEDFDPPLLIKGTRERVCHLTFGLPNRAYRVVHDQTGDVFYGVTDDCGHATLRKPD